MTKRILFAVVLALAACTEPSSHSDVAAAAVTACAGATVEGVDVSDAQGAIDWNAAAGAGIQWAAIKATQGTYNTQSTFAANWANARAAGVVRGAYHFFDPTEDGVAQAQHFLDVVGPLAADDLPPLLDLECPDGDSECLGFAGGTGAAPASVIHQRVADFLDTVQTATGKRPVIYTSNAYFSSNGIDASACASDPLWIAYPTSSGCFAVPSPWPAATMWQWSWTGYIPGIPDQVDRDRFLGTIDDLHAFARGSVTGATQFAWSGAWLSGFGTPDVALAADFTGDGKADLAWYEAWNDHAITIARSTGSSFIGTGKWLTGFGAPDAAFAADFDGDGKADLAWYEAWNNGTVTVALSTGDGFAAPQPWLSGFGKPDAAFVGDFDGDGKADLAWYEGWNNEAVTVVLSNGSSFQSAGKWLTGLGAPDWAAAGDVDGDGKTDLVWYQGGTAYVLGSTGGSFAAPSAWLSGLDAPDLAFAGDVDGDGKTDLAWYQANTVSVALSTGSAFAAPAPFVTGWGAPDWAALADFDGDGRADLGWYESWNDASVTVGLAR